MDDANEVRAADSQVAAPETIPARSPLTIEKFAASELTALRNELLRSGLDSWQAAEVATNFLTGHGYGVSSDQLRDAILRMESFSCSIDCLQAELERVAFIQ